MSVDYAAVLSSIRRDSEWSLNGNDYSGLVWISDDPKPTKKTLDDAWPQVQTDRAWRAIRAERDRRLAASDWTQVADAPVDAAAWATYRQELRDLPQNYILPDDVEWPEEPA